MSTTHATSANGNGEIHSPEEAEALLAQLARGALVVPEAAAHRRPAEVGAIDDVDASTLDQIQRLRQTEARYRALVEQIPAITFMANLAEGGENEIYVSPHIETMLGFTQKQWLDDPFLWHRQLHPDDRQRWGDEFALTCASGVQFRSEYRFISRDGRVVWVHGEARVVRDESGRPLFLQGIAFDITDTKLAEQSLRRSAEELESKVRERTAALQEATLRAELANRSRAAFLANMSHEIRTPLNAIIGFADLLRRGADSTPEERQEWLDIIFGGGKHLLALLDDILDLSKVDAGKLALEWIACSPVNLVNEICSILRSKAEEKGLSLAAVFDGPMPRSIHTDPTRLRQVLMNIAGNAIKFTASGSVTITVKADTDAQQPRLIFAVTDTGIGIPADKLDSIFEAFTQADSSVTRQFGGTGLGLTISRRLVELLGGSLSLQSEVGRGTTFTFDVATGPLDGVAWLQVGDGNVKDAPPPEQAREAPILSHRVLVVDDSDTNRKLVGLMLRRAGATVEQAEDGRQAVERGLAEPFDVILMDMQMPVMDGYTAARELRDHGCTAPIIALTANAMKGDDVKCREAGCTGYLAKPIDQDLLLKTVASLGTGAHAAAATTPANTSATKLFSAEPSAKPARLKSRLPTADPEFRAIVEQFVVKLHEQLAAMQTVLAAGDMLRLAQLAHWLAGTGGSAGFTEFGAPARRLEEAAKQVQPETASALIAELEAIANRIAIH
ncbi:MAG TPA: ATP-binding protein [Pirellulales bacterium]|nr:ATP-binding protein [Pirellulales bacterium]